MATSSRSRGGFKHRGEVVGVESGVLLISMRSATACEGCHAKGSCTVVGGGEERIMRIEREGAEGAEGAESYCVGDMVEVGIEYRVGFMAVFVAYILPLLLFVAVIAGLVLGGVDQGLAALGAFVVTAIYYIGVYIFKDRFERVVRFSVRKI